MIPIQKLLALSWLFIVLAACTGGSIADEPFFNPKKYHHTVDGFRNPPGSPEHVRSARQFMAFLWKRITEDVGEIKLPENHILPPEAAIKQFHDSPADSRITWIGHASFLIGWNGINILSDPHFSKRSSPFSFAGPQRFAPPGLNMEDLPKLDVIIISHNHYDSFDEDSLRALSRHSPDALVLTPLGLAQTIRQWGFKNARDMDWYDRQSVGDVTFMSTPAIHRANRWLFDVNETLWSGFTIESNGKKIWFVGDTAFGPVFERDLAKRIAPVDITLAPAGAFLPREVMQAAHTTPEESIYLAKIMGSKTAIGMHWGTFPLGADKPLDAIKRFNKTPTRGMRKIMMQIGQTLSLQELW
ncbi:MAG: hypothetical protein CBD27_05225 [Rhodospirillaceae bacterium TMED167]|nr:hypothetical protein [Rhodospirillaceae bacterium]OUW27954.1 MAG: hypothetical protein CBD27_05225 [Rhodospirillaceae bacterium TMED167]